MGLKYRLARWREDLTILVAFLLPRQLAYWCAIRVAAYATQGQHGDQEVPTLTAMDALKRWEM